MNPNRSRIFAILAVVAALVITLSAYFFTQQRTYQTVRLIMPQGVTANIYDSNEVDEEHSSDKPAEILATVKDDKEVRLKKGGYTAITEANSAYQSARVSFTLDQDKTTVEIKPSVSEVNLQSKLTSERTAIMLTLTKAYPLISSLYTVEKGKLYTNGEWYGTLLTYKGLIGQYPNDTLRVVLHKENGGWKVAIPPQIALSAPQHPEVPDAVIRDLNLTEK